MLVFAEFLELLGGDVVEDVLVEVLHLLGEVLALGEVQLHLFVGLGELLFEEFGLLFYEVELVVVLEILGFDLEGRIECIPVYLPQLPLHQTNIILIPIMHLLNHLLQCLPTLPHLYNLLLLLLNLLPQIPNLQLQIIPRHYPLHFNLLMIFR